MVSILWFFLSGVNGFKNKKNNTQNGVSADVHVRSPKSSCTRRRRQEILTYCFFILCHLICYLGGIYHYLVFKSIFLTILWYTILIPTTIGSIIIFSLYRREIVEEFVEFWNQYKNNKTKNRRQRNKNFFPIMKVFIK